MWDRSYRWQRHVRLAAGCALLLSLVFAAALLARTSAADRTRAGARELARELLSPAQQTIRVQVPATLLSRPGTLVYQEREDGVAQVIGRVVTVERTGAIQDALTIRLSANSAVQSRQGGFLKAAPAALSLGDAVRLLVSPNAPGDEALIARDTIWPSIRTHLLPEVMDGLVREISSDLTGPGPENARLLNQFAGSLRQAIEPLEEKLVERLARRAWEIVGVGGIASGVLRSTTDNAADMAKSVAAWWSWFQGTEMPKKDAPERPFLSPELSQALKEALEAEVLTFWNEHREQILTAFKTSVDAQRPEIDKAFSERWSGQLYERVIEPAWQAHQTEVIASIETYVRDFSNRRLLTRSGGPRLQFAFVLRSSLDISSAPLLILAPSTRGDSNQFVYQPLLP